MGNRPTVYDVAERAGVSIATVSFAFRHPHKVKESTRHAVQAAARELGYIPSASARGLANGRTGVLGLLWWRPDESFWYRDHPPGDAAPGDSRASPPADPNANFRLYPLYMDEVQRGMEWECWRRGYAVMVAGANASNRDAVLADIAGRVDGLAVVSGAVADAELRTIAERLPVAVLSASGLDAELPRISVDNAAGMRDMVEHLVHTHGLRDIAFVGSTYDSDRSERFEAVQATLRTAGLPVPREPIAATGDKEMALDLIDRNALPDAFVCETDEVALALMDALHDLAIDVPGRVAVTGFDGLVAGRLSSPQLTTVRQPMVDMGAEVVEILIDRLERAAQPARSRLFPVQLVVRQSCGCPGD